VAAVYRITDSARRDELLQAWENGKNRTLLPFCDDPAAYIVSANIRRRHLTAEQRREIIAKLLKENPERSDRATAKIAGVHHETVASVRENAERRGEIRHVETRADTKGRQQPARKKAMPRPTAPSTPLSQVRDKAIMDFSQALHQQLANTLDDLTRILKGEGARIREISLPKRIVIARAYLDALGVSLDDLHIQSSI
jgi:hypothetical protein